ncbi:MAG TPA: DUF4397 domain-containing protein [Flavisolibacter sp.]|nr:DUF4397 domain-containing protein [Flavisolibacter sp.]
MKKYSQIIFATALALVLLSCKKYKDETSGLSSAVFIHASPGTPSAQIYLDTLLQSILTNSSYSLSYSAGLTGTTTFSSGYVGIYPGSHKISLENRSTNPKKVFININQDFERNKFYSFFLYDTLNASGEAKILRLTDDLSIPASGNTKIRFLNLAPNSGSLDVTLVRGTAFDTSSTSTQKLDFVATDSVTISSQAYVGATPDVNALSAFKTSVPGTTGEAIAKAKTIATVPGLNKNNRYIIKLKAAGTQNVLAQSTVIALNAGGIYTIFARGTAQGQALGVSVFAHYLQF